MQTMKLEKYVLLNVGESFEFNGHKATATSSTTIEFKMFFGTIIFDLSKADGVLYHGSESKLVFSLDRGYFGKSDYQRYQRTIGVNCSVVENTDL